eukprot:CAMPEP_0202906214 /NCGR_PEP_ID=MMETSP1392-20130828/37817_1 /ASSEMBLY_ACC=CAM_ASM_000868 /TAXON_ID=225041 /ORGANISM="Chlamydomonas chlamydogama, Strain SAG 11-48b" /LENGTH=109 /DNA_ID=CAMNT_0049594611 /DNA_START=121 /DNA_END=450 /DNA_ORIENTATION=-
MPACSARMISQGHHQPDPFQGSLQSKTEQELFDLIERNKARKSVVEHLQADSKQDNSHEHEHEHAHAGDEEDDLMEVVNPETREHYGPRGKEPTRFGDWEIKGRCTDFS